jgi:predicted enzyme related to lactoylglutathione lyase
MRCAKATGGSIMNRPFYFEIHVENPERAMKFYKRLFGWEFQKYEPATFDYWFVTTGKEGTPGIDGGMIRRTGKTPGAKAPIIAYVCTIDVENIDKSMKAVEKAGGVQAVAKQAIPTMGWTVYYKDPEANIFGLYQVDKNAK